MAIIYELWDTTTRNLVAEFPTTEQAREAIRSALRSHGRAAIEIMSLGTEDGDGNGEVIARGTGLVEWAERETPKESNAGHRDTVHLTKARVVSNAFGLKTSKGRSGTWSKQSGTVRNAIKRSPTPSGKPAKYQPVGKKSKTKRER